jgi:ribulose bisphosphate carboxylase small subunit
VERVNFILDTDYTNYAISYDCQSIGEQKSQQLYWLMSRTPELTKDMEILARIAELKAKYIDEKLVKVVVMDPML